MLLELETPEVATDNDDGLETRGGMAGGVCWYVLEPGREVRGGSCIESENLVKVNHHGKRDELTFGAAPVLILLG